MKISWKVKTFEGLTVKELYSVLRLRAEVFVVEQNCPYLDLDEKDQKCFHLMGYNEIKELISYARIVPAGVSFDEVSIGRVVSSPKVRNTGAGKELMQKSIEEIKIKFGLIPIRIGAQLYLKKFYENFGFVAEGKEYLEDDIPHIEMLKR